MTDQKQHENVEYFNCLDRMITDYTRATHEMKSRVAMVKAAFKRRKRKKKMKRRRVFTSKLDLNVLT
jgi:hypothetical protein